MATKLTAAEAEAILASPKLFDEWLGPGEIDSTFLARIFALSNQVNSVEILADIANLVAEERARLISRLTNLPGGL